MQLFVRSLLLPLSIVLLAPLAACGQGKRTRDTQAEKPPVAEPVSPAPPKAIELLAASSSPEAPKAPPPKPQGPRIYSKARFAWIQPQPRTGSGWIGYLGIGSSVPLRGGSLEAAHVRGDKACKDWYAVEPVGYVCAGDTATIDPNDPVVLALAIDAPKVDSPWPYEYGESIGAPRFPRLPTEAEQRRAEWDLAQHLSLVAKARAGDGARDKSLEGVDLDSANQPTPEWSELSPFVREERKRVAPGSTLAYTRSFDYQGRTYLVTHDHAIVPKDRVKPYPRSSFQGIVLDDKTTLPIAFFRQQDRPKYRRAVDGSFAKAEDMFPRLGHVALTGASIKTDQGTFLETRQAGIYVLASDASVARAEPEIPSMVRAQPEKSRRTWISVHILSGTFVAYEFDKPVYATLISPGRGGAPIRGVDPLETASTPTGTFRVDGKFVTATMVSSTNDLLIHTEVQYIQNFHGPHSLHAAYWHDDWGEKKSGGCVNLSPIDAKHVFEWTDPPVPDSWYGMRAVSEFGPATVVVVEK